MHFISPNSTMLALRTTSKLLLRKPLAQTSRSTTRSFSTATPNGTNPLADTEDEAMLRSTIAKFAKDKIEPKVREMDEKSKLAPEVLKGLFDQGLMGIEIPSQYNGSGLGFTSSIIAIEELAKVDPAVSVVVDVQNTLVINLVMRFGTKEQKEKFLPKLATEYPGSFCLSESGSGSDAFALKTRAVQDGDHFILNGSKAWITNSGEAGLFIVMANVDPSKGYKGITAFLVERGHPGLEVGKREDKLGIRASSTCEVILNDCKVHKSQILGELGKGYKVAIETLNEGRIGIAAQMLGLAQGAFSATLPYIHQRKQFGQVIASFQGMQFQMAECATAIEASRLLVYNAARLREANQSFVSEAAMAKWFAARTAEKVASQCINMLGGVGFIKEFKVEKFFRDSKIGQIYEGTDNIHLQTIAKLISKDFSN